MAHSVIFLLLSLILLYRASTSQSYQPKVQAFLHPIYKDKTTNLYSLPLTIGSNLRSRNFLIDLNGAAPLLQNCAASTKSTSYHSIRCGSTRCKFANPNSSCPKNTTSMPMCRKYVSTSFSDRPVNARLLRDTVGLLYTPNGVYSMDSEKISTLTLTCTDDATAFKPIPKAFGGSIGLANNHLSVPSQLISMYKLPPKMSICLPSTEGMKSYYNGDFWIGGGPFFYLPYLKDVSKIFASTPLIGNNKSEYLIDVKSIQVSGKTVPILPGPTKICTLAPYTVLQSSIYKALVTAFVGSVNMAKAPTVKPFSACFQSNGGRGVPVIDLVMSGGAKWRIHGSNSLVKVNKDVVCLGFVDGGVNPKNPILIGGFQMEDNLVQFDLKASKFSFSSSLLLYNTSCSVSRMFGM
ncbi:Eukaryotic aspartyl protease family protein [Raphanus sativus]|uniref:Probable aspartic proteinase GIP2 n=1 Tax=Raphanus sativus TaxID=3726 RepID=A0A6J0MC80_RAPSA|nr:probable aspartic proteinase GIP2 [Raphanus sativus]KAJ4916785.1 Eukaryotic aspartyl protease family protein [Raphanus sativus]